MDHPGGVFTWLHMRATDMLSVALRSLAMPSSDTAWRMELTVPRNPYKAEFTNRKTLPAKAVSFSIKSEILANETSSCAKLAINRLRIGEKGGSWAKARSAWSLTLTLVGAAEPVTVSLSDER
jgi:hypothetical protein